MRNILGCRKNGQYCSVESTEVTVTGEIGISTCSIYWIIMECYCKMVSLDISSYSFTVRD